MAIFLRKTKQVKSGLRPWIYFHFTRLYIFLASLSYSLSLPLFLPPNTNLSYSTLLSIFLFPLPTYTSFYLLSSILLASIQSIMGFVIGNIYVITTVAVTGGALFGFDIASMSAMYVSQPSERCLFRSY